MPETCGYFPGPGGTPLYGGFPADGAIIDSTSSHYAYPELAVSVIEGHEIAIGEFTGGNSLEVAYAGISPGEVFGLLQVNFRVPDTLPSDPVSPAFLYVSLQIGSAASGWVPIHVAR